MKRKVVWRGDEDVFCVPFVGEGGGAEIWEIFGFASLLKGVCECLPGGGDPPQKKPSDSLGSSGMFQPRERRYGVEEVPGDEGAMAPSWLLVLGVFFPLTPPFWYLFIPNYCFYLIKGGGHEVAVSSALALCLRMRLSDFMLIMV